jgi:ethanolamine utilization protein EutP (predicted NTPase)
VKQRPFIPSSEIALFNLLHFVSREFFLVFAKIPIRTLVQVSVDDIDVRREVGKALRTVTADYVFVHPGTMLPKKVVMVDSADQDLEQSSSVSTVMKVICQQAEIDIVWLNANRNYSVNELSEVLGLKEDT